MKTSMIILILVFASSFAGAGKLITDPVDPSTCGGKDQPPCPVSYTMFRDGCTPKGEAACPTEAASKQPLEANMSISFDLTGEPAGTYKYHAIHHSATGGKSKDSNPTWAGPPAPSNLRASP